MFGKPMISCEIGTGTTFINIAGETGLVVPPCDSGALGQAMLSLWQNPEMASTMGKNALRRYEAIFSADIMAESYAKLYNELLQ